MKGKLTLLQRLMPASAVDGAPDKPTNKEEGFLEAKAGTIVNIEGWSCGRYLVEKDGYYCWVSPSWIIYP